MQSIKKGDIVLHQLSGLYYQCENNKTERWMNTPNNRLWPFKNLLTQLVGFGHQIDG